MLVSVPVLPLIPWRILELRVCCCHVSGALKLCCVLPARGRGTDEHMN